MSARYLIVPDTRTGHGTGHIVRASRLACELGGEGCLIIDYPWEHECHPESQIREMAAQYGENTTCSWAEVNSGTAAFVIIDAQHLSRSEHRLLRGIAPTIGIDIGGEGRAFCSYLIDTLPNLETHRPNVFDPGLNYLHDRGSAAGTPGAGETRPVGPPAGETPPAHEPGSAAGHRATAGAPRAGDERPTAGRGRILVAAGGEDPAGLGGKCVRALEQSGAAAQGTVDLARGALSGELELSEYKCLGTVLRTAQLAGILPEYDVVITTFGLTAYEALAAGCTVLTVAPTRYHARLSRTAGLPLIGRVRQVSARRIRRALGRLPELARRQDALRPVTGSTLAGLIRTLEAGGVGGSPVSGGYDMRAVHRSTTRTYRASETPAIDYLERFVPGSTSYNENYFFEDYEKQYGRSYLEDFEHIADMCRGRLDEIERVHATGRGAQAGTPPLLVDLGCAYGPMLSAASDREYRVKGSDWYEGAVQYVRDTLRLPATQGDVCDPGLPEALGVTKSADVVCMWYVIEHLRDLGPLFSNVQNMLKPGGVFAFSTPNGSGGSATHDRASFLDNSPEDHWTIWKARGVRRFLKRKGFRSVRIRVTGHHPERFAPRLCRSSAGYRAALVWSRIAGLGDTFEAYAIFRGARFDTFSKNNDESTLGPDHHH